MQGKRRRHKRHPVCKQRQGENAVPYKRYRGAAGLHHYHESGAGGVFPGDLLIGRVDSVERSNADSSYYAILTPYVDVTEVTDVFVVTDFDGKGDVTTGLPETNNKDEEDPAQTASKGNE